MADRDISPPPTKRARLSAPALVAPSIPTRPITALKEDMIRIFAWNVNGIAPFLQPAITSFFPKSLLTTPEKSTTHSRSTTCGPEDPFRASLGAKRDPNCGSPSLSACLERWKYPSMVCLQEVKISPTDTKTPQAIRQAVKTFVSTTEKGRGETGYTAHFSLPRDKFNARGFAGKVYGVCTLVRNDLLETENLSKHIKKADWDLEGRVLIVELPKEMIVVFNVYAVNGTENPYRDPKTGAVVGTRHDRKRVFHSELAEETAKYEKQGWIVVIAGDINIARSPLDGFPGIRLGEAHVKNRMDFDRKFMSKREGLGMTDSFRHLHGDERKYSYRSRGVVWGASCDRVDMILVSNRATAGPATSNDEAVKSPVARSARMSEADILDEELERGSSDHVPIYVTLKTYL